MAVLVADGRTKGPGTAWVNTLLAISLSLALAMVLSAVGGRAVGATANEGPFLMLLSSWRLVLKVDSSRGVAIATGVCGMGLVLFVQVGLGRGRSTELAIKYVNPPKTSASPAAMAPRDCHQGWGGALSESWRRLLRSICSMM